MPRSRKQEHPGRPVEDRYLGRKRRPIMTNWPEDIITYIDEKVGLGHRTRWLIEAAEEKIAREKEQS